MKKTRATKKRATKPATKVEIIIKQEKPTTDIVPMSALSPEMQGTKYMIPQKNWITEKQVLQILQRTPKEHIYSRPGKGSQSFTYVTGHYVKKVLNFVFGWNWDFKVVSHERIASERGDQIIVLGSLTVKDDKGHSITKEQFGRAEVKYYKGTKDPVDYGNDLKAATTDALKKCASEFGIASDVYGSNEFKEVGKEVATVTENKQAGRPVAETNDMTKWSDCENGCGAKVSPQVENYSKKMFKNKVYCRDCQAEKGQK